MPQTPPEPRAAELPRVKLDTRMPPAPAPGHTVIRVAPPAPGRLPRPHAAAYVTAAAIACTCVFGWQRLSRRGHRRP
jgi:hypothetical protein